MTPAKGFSEMKDSGFPDIKFIPCNWSIQKVKHIFNVICGATPKVNPENWDEDIIWVTPADMPVTGFVYQGRRNISKIGYESCGTTLIPKGSIVISTRAPIGKICLAANSLCTNQGCKTLVPKNKTVDTKFYFYYLQSIVERMEVDGSGTTFKELSTTNLLNEPVLIPPVFEQSAIATYLDTQCAKIDEIIAQAKASIEDYKQWKASIIYEAVTKGLDPNVEMKDSGIEWIGKMPFDWAVIRVKNLLAEINERSETGSEESLSMSQVLGIVPSSMIAVANPATSYVGAKIVRPNDLVFNKLKAHLGVFAVSNYDGLVSPDYAVYRANERANPKFLEYLFKTPNCIQEFKKYITGVGMGLSRLYTSDLFNIKAALPAIDVQKHIVEYLNDFCSQADALIDEKQALIDDLESYKKSLIYEVVTEKRKIQ